MQSNSRQACNPVLSPGALGVQSHVSLVFPVEAHTEQVRVPLVTCAEEGGCLHPPRSGDVGTGRLMSTRRGKPLFHLSLILGIFQEKFTIPDFWTGCFHNRFNMRIMKVLRPVYFLIVIQTWIFSAEASAALTCLMIGCLGLARVTKPKR